MGTSAELTSTRLTTAKKMVVMLVLAFLGSQLSLFGGLVLLLVYTVSGLSPNLGSVIVAVLLAFILLSASFLFLGLYPERGWRQVLAAFLAVILWMIGMTASYSVQLFHTLGIDPYESILHSRVREMTIAVAIMVCLLMSGRIQGWLELIGLGVGVAIGIAMHGSNLYGPTSLDYTPLWLSAVFTSELYSQRAGWKTAWIGLALWGGLIVVAALIVRVLWLLSGGVG